MDPSLKFPVTELWRTMSGFHTRVELTLILFIPPKSSLNMNFCGFKNSW